MDNNSIFSMFCSKIYLFLKNDSEKSQFQFLREFALEYFFDISFHSKFVHFYLPNYINIEIFEFQHMSRGLLMVLTKNKQVAF